jgi:signal transduction histidine kinase
MQQMHERTGKLFLESESKIKDMSEEMLNLLVMKQEFINNISHEIRTPMHHIGIGAQAIFKDWDKYDNSQRKEFAEVIYKGYQNASQHINNILDLSHLSTNSINLKLENVDFPSLIAELIEEFKELYLDQNNDVEFIYTTEASQTQTTCDREKIKRVVINLIKNAVDYSSGKAIEIKLTNVKVNNGEKEVDGIQFSIKDYGVGIPENELLHIFGPFIQSSYTKKTSGGKGLGLTLCEQIIQLHRGTIWAENNVGEPGATFYFIIPC